MHVLYLFEGKEVILELVCVFDDPHIKILR